MIKGLLSIVIPSRSPEYLQKTVNDLLVKAEGEIEITVILDGVWAENFDYDCDKRVKIIHHGTVHSSLGMREGINRGMALAKGEYVMKIDEHCMVGKGFDKILKADCEEHDVIIPRRKRLDPDKWEIIEDGRNPIDYMMIDYPFQRPNDKTCGLHGAEDRQRYSDRKDILIDEVMTMQGSFYFTTRKHWDEVIHFLDSEKYGNFTQEAQEISNATWLFGGRVMVNKKTWYAHAHKGSKGKRYNFSNAQYKQHGIDSEKGRVYCINYWMNTKDFKYDFEWLIKKFWPLKGWPENWKEQVIEDAKKEDNYSFNFNFDNKNNMEEVSTDKVQVKEKSFKNRIELAKYFAELGFTNGAEIGVFEGYYSKVLLDNIPNLKLLCVDNWVLGELFPKMKRAIKIMSPYPDATIIRKESVVAAKDVEDRSLDFVFIDALHDYDNVKKDIDAWTPKVRIGGIVSGHDYYETKTHNTGVMDAVDGFVKRNNYDLQLTEWDKQNPNRDDRQPSWFFIKDK